MERDNNEAAHQQQLEQQEMEEEAMKSLFAAFVKAQAHIEKASKDKNNPHFRSKYADLGSVVDAIKPALEENGLGFIQKLHDDDRAAKVETIIVHSSGEQFSCGILSIPASKHDAQGFGSALTYCRRYSLQAAFGVAPDDDDGNAAVAAKPKQDRRPAAKPAGVDLDDAVDLLNQQTDVQALQATFAKIWKAAADDQKAAIKAAYDDRKTQLESQKEAA